MTDFRIPAGMNFADLALELADDGTLFFRQAVLGEFMRRNGIDPEATDDEDVVSEMICTWYFLHRERTGAIDTVMEAILDAGQDAQPSSESPAGNPRQS